MSEGIEEYDGLAVRLRVCLDRAWARLQSLPPLELASTSARTKSNLVHDFLTEAVEAEFFNDDMAQFVETRGLKHLTSEYVRIRFKKFNRRLLVASNRTSQSQSWIQIPMPGVTKVLSFTFGYRPDALWSKIETAGLALQVHDQVPWFLEVRPVEDFDSSDSEGTVTDFGDRQIKVKYHILKTRQAELHEQSDFNAESLGES